MLYSSREVYSALEGRHLAIEIIRARKGLSRPPWAPGWLELPGPT